MGKIFVSINHPNLMNPVYGCGEVIKNKRGIKGVSIFIPTESGEILLMLLEEKRGKIA